MKDKVITSDDGLLSVRYSEVEKVCMSGSIYALLQYILMTDDDVALNKTCYFLGYGVSKKVSEHLPAVYFATKQTGTIWTPSRWCDKIRIRLTKNCRYPFLKTANIYALDSGFVAPLIGRRPYSLLSDGPLCLSQNMQETSGEYLRQQKKHHSLIGRLEGLFYGPVAISNFGNNDQCKEFYMTEENESPVLEGKIVHISSLQTLWEQSSEKKKDFIKYLFDITAEDLSMLCSRNLMFLTQPMVKDRVLTEQEYVNVLTEVFSHYNQNELLLKLHPRDSFDYKKYFPEVEIFRKPVNMQLLVLLGVSVRKAITICSSSINSFPESVEADWFGVDLHPNIREFFGGSVRPSRHYNQM